MKKWKRSDIPERLVLEVYEQPFAKSGWRDEELMRLTGAPGKVVWAAMDREDRKGHLDYGTNLRGGWLTDEGKQRLAQLRGAEPPAQVWHGQPEPNPPSIDREDAV